MGSLGFLLGFMERSYKSDDHLNSQDLENFLVGEEYEFDRLEGYHPDYEDARVILYRIWK